MSNIKAGQELWRARPWILPNALFRTLLIGVIVIGAFLAEGAWGISVGFPVFVWTLIVFFFVWLLWLFDLFILWMTNVYILRNDSLEIRRGLITSQTLLIVPTGFSDLEVNRSIIGRILNTGDILIKTQSEKDFAKKMVKIRDPLKVAGLIRNVMAKPIFRVEDRDFKNNDLKRRI